VSVALPAIINGLAIGGLYSLFALSIVVIFNTGGSINFAQGNMAMFVAYLIYESMQHLHYSVELALPLGLVVGAGFGFMVYRLIILPRRSPDHLNQLFRTLGLGLLLYALAEFFWGQGEPYSFPSALGNGGFQLGSYRVSWLQAGMLGIALVLALCFAAFLRGSRWGLMLRMVASDRDVASMIGVRASRIESISWCIVGAFAAVTGILFAAFFSLSGDMMDNFLIFGFTAALVGGLTSLRGAIAGGLLIGVVDSVMSVYSKPEWDSLTLLGIMLVVMYFRPSGLFGQTVVNRV
jgi:branched-chain amino acid transport system permease protein